MLLRRHLLQGLCMLHLHGGDSLVLRRSTALSRLSKKPSATATYQAILSMYNCTYFGRMYGIKTIQQCFIQSPSCIVSPTTSCKGHWLQLATTISLPYSLVRRQQLNQEKFPAWDAIQRYLLGVYMCVIVSSSSFYCICCHFFYFTLYFMHAVMVCVCQILLNKLLT